MGQVRRSAVVKAIEACESNRKENIKPNVDSEIISTLTLPDSPKAKTYNWPISPTSSSLSMTPARQDLRDIEL